MKSMTMTLMGQTGGIITPVVISQKTIIIIYGLCALTILAAFLYAMYLTKWVRIQPNENTAIKHISGLILSGANAFMKKNIAFLRCFLLSSLY